VHHHHFHGYQKGTNPIELAITKQQNSRKKSAKTKNTKSKNNKIQLIFLLFSSPLFLQLLVDDA